MVGVQITGLDRLAEEARAMAEALTAYNEKATEENLKDAKGKSVERAPYKTGTLRRSIAYTKPATVDGVTSGAWGSDLPYARILELGGTIPAHTYTHPNLFGKGISAEITVPAQERSPRPYLFPVLVENIEDFLGRYRKAYSEAVKSVRPQ